MSLGKYRAMVKKRKELREEAAYLERKAELAQLNIRINPELKSALQERYGKNLAKMFEEQMIEKLEKDGFQFDKKKSNNKSA